MDKPQPQYHISDITWRRIQPHLPGQKGQWGGIARDNRLFIDAVLWVLRTGAPWRKLPEEYGKWGTVHHRFIRWRDKRLWEKLLEILIDDPDFAWLIVDTGPCGEHRGGAVFLPAPRQMKHHAASPRGSHPATSRPWGRQACPAGSAPASALDSMLRCRPRRGRSGACHDGRQQRRRTPCFHMTVPAHYRRTSPQDAAPRPRGKVPPASRNCRTGMAPHGAGNLGYGRLPHCTGRLRRQRPLRTADGKDARQAPPVFRERFGPGHGKRHFPAGTAT